MGDGVSGDENTFGPLLRRLRTAARLTQEEVAARSGLSVRSLRAIERGTVRYPRPDSAHRLAVALGLDGERRTRFEQLARATYWTDRAKPDPIGGSLSPAQLPPVVSDVVDRPAHLAALELVLARARPGTVTTVVITGGGGTGKTTLAVRWAHLVAHRFPAGTFHLDLRGFSTDPPVAPAEALRLMLSALGTPPDRIPTDVGEAAALYRTLLAGRAVLVLLDNAASADQVVPLLPAGPGSLVVTTSRSPLGGLVIRHGASRVAVGPLDEDEAMTLLGRVVGADRVAADRAAAQRLVAGCGYLALAVRIAAARALDRPHGSLARYTAEFTAGDPLDALECDDAAVRRTFLLSYRRLDAGMALVFRRASLVDGPSFDVSAVAEVAGLAAPAAAAALDRLRAAHLVEPVEAADGDRFRFHDLLRRYARERCDADDDAAALDGARSALLGWYVGHVRAAGVVLYPQKIRVPGLAEAGRTQVSFACRRDALAWLDTHRSALLAAVRRHAEQGPRSAVWLLACSLRGYFDLRGETADWIAVAELAVDAAGAEAAPPARAAAEYALAQALRAGGRTADAIVHARRSLHFGHEARSDEAQWLACAALGSMSVDNGAVGAARGYLARALEISRRLDNVAGEANALDNLCTIDIRVGRLVRAERDLRAVLRLYRQAGMTGGEGHALVRLAELLWAFDLDRDARRHAHRAVLAYRSAGHRIGEAYASATAAAMRPGSFPDTAVRQAGAAVELLHETGDRGYELKALMCLAALHHSAGDDRAANAAYSRCVALARQIDEPHQLGAALVGLAQVAGARGADHLDEAAGIAAAHGFRVVAADARMIRARMLIAAGRVTEGLAAARSAGGLHRLTGHARGERQVRELIARAPAALAT